MCGNNGFPFIVKKEANCYADVMNKALKAYSLVFLFLYPLALLPTAVDVLGFGKNWILGAGAILGLVLWIATMLIEKRNEVRTNKLFWLLSLLLVWSLVGWFGMPLGARMRSLMEPMGLGSLAALWVWVFVWLQVRSEKQEERQVVALTAAGVVLALISVIVFMIPNVKLPINIPRENPIVSIGQGWSLAGSLYAETLLIGFLAFEWIKRLSRKLKVRGSYVAEVIMSAIFVLVTLLNAYKIFTYGWMALDHTSAWVIAVETLKASPFTGAGIGNFARAFVLYRPASYNLTPYWSMIFADSSMGFFHLWTELGIGGLLAVMLAISGILKKRKMGADFWQGVLLVAVNLFLPINVVGLFLLLWVAANRLSTTRESKMVLMVGENNFNAMPSIVGVVVIALIGFGGFWWGKILGGDYYFRQSLVAASGNDGGKTYDLQIKAIGLNPYSGEYRRVYSQTNMALAENILTNEELSEEDREKASVLIQQAVREARAAITMDNLNSSYWTNLAVIYRSLVGVVDETADWSFQAYQQASALDPVNPMLKLDLGGLLYAANRIDDADRVFEQVVTNKSDFANGWYNWAHTAKMTNRIADAYQRLAQAVSLVPPDSTDFENANELLAEWKKELDQAIKQQEEMAAQQASAEEQQEPEEETLKTADPLPTMGEEERVDVPAEELEPPLPTEEPVVEPTAMPTEMPEEVEAE